MKNYKLPVCYMIVAITFLITGVISAKAMFLSGMVISAVFMALFVLMAWDGFKVFEKE